MPLLFNRKFLPLLLNRNFLPLIFNMKFLPFLFNRKFLLHFLIGYSCHFYLKVNFCHFYLIRNSCHFYSGPLTCPQSENGKTIRWIQPSERLAYLGIMGEELRAALKPLEYRNTFQHSVPETFQPHIIGCRSQYSCNFSLYFIVLGMLPAQITSWTVINNCNCLQLQLL